MSIYFIYGGPGGGKSTFGISADRETWYAELDPGSFDRCKNGMDTSLVTVYEAYPPLEELDEGMLSTAMVGASGNGAVQVIHKLTGWHEVLMDLRREYLKAVADPRFPVLTLDTGDFLWDMVQNAMFQRIQQGTNVHREKLARLEYEDCNQTMTWFILLAKKFKKDLVLISTEREEWSGGKTTGEWIPGGWDRSEYWADRELRVSMVDHKPMGKIIKAGGADMAIIDMLLPVPTLPTFELLVDCAAALRRAGIPIPETTEQVIQQGEMMGVGG